MLKAVRSTDESDHRPFKMGSNIFRTSSVVRITDDYRLINGSDLFDRVPTNMSVWKLSVFFAKDF